MADNLRRSGSFSLQTANPLAEILSTTKVNQLDVAKHHLVKLKTEQKIKEVLSIFNEHDILSAPVYDGSKKTYTGIVDLRDFVAFVLSTYVIGEPVVFNAEKLSDLSGVNPFVPVNDNQTLLEVLKDFNINHVNRMPVIDHAVSSPPNHDEPHPHILYMLSQSDIVVWLAHNIDKLGHAVYMTLKELNFGGLGSENNMISQAISVHQEDTVLSALSILEKFRIHGVPVVDKDGAIVADFSVKDIKFIVPTYLDHLNVELEEFFSKIEDKRPGVATCTVDTTFAEAIQKMASMKVHRVHIVDDNKRPVDVITMTNVLDTILVLATGARRR